MAHKDFDEYDIRTKRESWQHLELVSSQKLTLIRHMYPSVGIGEQWEIWIEGKKYSTAYDKVELRTKETEARAELATRRQQRQGQQAAQRTTTPASTRPSPASRLRARIPRRRRSIIAIGLVLVIVLGSIVFLVTSPHPSYTYTGHSGSVNDVAWSPDGKLIASASDDKTVRIWNALTGDTIMTYKGHSAAVAVLAWSPNGKYIASSGADGTQIWTVKDGKKILPLYNPANSLSWSPDSKYLASVITSGAITVLDLDNPSILAGTNEQNPIDVASWSPNGKYIAYGDNLGNVTLWNPKTNEKVRAIPANEATSFVQFIVWSHDSNNIAVDYGYKVRGYTINPVIGTKLFSYAKETFGGIGNRTIAWSPNGQEIASLSSNSNESIEVREIANGTILTTYNGHANVYLGHFSTGIVTSIAYSPDGTRIASAGTDRTVQVWQAPTA